MVTTATTTIIDAASAIAIATSATIIASAATACPSPDVHHRRPLVTFSHHRWGAISIFTIVAFSSTSTAAVVTTLLLQLCKVSIRAARSV